KIDLPRGVLVRGKIREAASDRPVAEASVQFLPDEKNNRNLRSNLVTGWEGTVVSGDDGTFRIAVPAGRGHLLIHSPASDYVLQEIGSSEIVYGKPGGERYYAHGLVRLDLKPGDDVHDVAVTFRRGARVSGRLIGPDGKPVAQALMISRLNIT